MRIKSFIFVLSLISIMSCGGDNGGPTTPPVTPPTTTSVIPQARITLAASNAMAYTSNEGNVFVFDLRITETGGGGANINFIRLQVVRPTGELVETKEHGANVIIDVTGSNRIEANQSRLLEQVAFIFRSAFKGGPTMVVTVEFGDDTGRTFQEVIRFVYQG